jgi:hypothetical protein
LEEKDMKKEKMIFIIILLVCVGGVLGILYFNKINKYSYTLNIPSDDSVYSINLEQNGKRIEVSEQDKIKDIIYVISEVKRTTTNESIQDSPINVENEIKIDFEYEENKTSTVFVYKKNGKYFVEQPYNGIYRISPDEYNSIEKYISN